MNKYINFIETVVNVLTLQKGQIRILVKVKDEEPFKDKYILPGNILTTVETVEENIDNVLLDITNQKNYYLKLVNIYSDVNRDANERVIACSYIAVIDINHVKEGCKWVNIDEIHDMGYDHAKIITDAKNTLKQEIRNNNLTLLKNLFINTFTLPELQKVYEFGYGKSLDRRNFRKKVINDDLVEDTNEKEKYSVGRPGNLYKFKGEKNEQ